MNSADVLARPHRHVWYWSEEQDDPQSRVLGMVERCRTCGQRKDAARSRRGATARNYGNRAELKVARTYGGTKIGHHGGPVDVRGVDFDTQVKTHRRLPPAEWRKAFVAMAGERCPRILERFVSSVPGQPPVDYFVFRASDFLDWFGKDEA